MSSERRVYAQNYPKLAPSTTSQRELQWTMIFVSYTSMTDIDKLMHMCVRLLSRHEGVVVTNSSLPEKGYTVTIVL